MWFDRFWIATITICSIAHVGFSATSNSSSSIEFTSEDDSYLSGNENYYGKSLAQNDEPYSSFIDVRPGFSCKNSDSFEREVKYNVGDMLGEGGYGQVFLGSYNNNNISEAVALKRLDAKLVNDESLQAILYGRLSVYEQLSHPNIAKFKGCYRAHGTIWIMMEYVNGKVLDEFEGVELDEITIFYILYLLTDAVKYLHSKGVAHRDIKGGNIIITEDGGLKLIDFDLLATFADKEGPINAAGTPRYMAPEALEHFVNGHYEDSYDLMAVDIWSCGIITYELATGGLPTGLAFPEFDDKSPRHLASEISRYYNENSTKTGPMWPIGDGSVLDELLGQMLSWNPMYRLSLNAIHEQVKSLLMNQEEIAKQRLVEKHNDLFERN